MGVIKKFPLLEAHFLADAGLPAPSPAALSGGLRCFLRPSRHTSPWTSRRGSDQVPHTHQIVGGRCPGKHPGDTLPAPASPGASELPSSSTQRFLPPACVSSD